MSVSDLNQFFYSLLECSHDVFWISDNTYQKKIYVNPAFEKIWGISRKNLYLNDDVWYMFIHQHDLLNYIKKITEFKIDYKNGEVFSHEYRIYSHNKQVKKIREVSFPLFDSNQELIGFAGNVQDVTRVKEYLVEIEKASYYFKLFTEKMSATFWVMNSSCNNQIYVSPSYEKIWGRSRQSLYDNPDSWLDSLHPEDRQFGENCIRLRLNSENGPDKQYEYKYRILRPNGEVRWIKDISFPIHDEQANLIGFAGIGEDITKEVIHEQELQAAKQKAETANQVKSDFLAMVSHELRTPLNAILGMAQILKTRELSDENLDYVNIISNAGNSLLSLVNDILDFARLEVGKLTFSHEVFNLKNLFSQLVQNMQYLAQEKNIKLTLNYSIHVPEIVKGDPHRVQQVLLNLLSNALKFTNQGYIYVEVNKLLQQEKNTLFEIKVVDTGIGISEEHLEKIFEKFSQIDAVYNRKQGGIGLGLAITKELVNAMGGEVQVKSETQQGSEFRLTIFLEAVPPEQQQASIHLLNQLNHLNNSKRKQYKFDILLVEDNVINQKIAKIMLEDFGCQVTIVSNGCEALIKLKNEKYNLILMDIGLPDMSGFEVTVQVRNELHLKNIPIVAMTAHVLDSDKQRAYKAGMNKILVKPISYQDIEEVLQIYTKQDLVRIEL